MDYLIVSEKTATGFSGYAPDLRYHIGRKMGRGWVFTEKDIVSVPGWS